MERKLGLMSNFHQILNSVVIRGGGFVFWAVVLSIILGLFAIACSGEETGNESKTAAIANDSHVVERKSSDIQNPTLSGPIRIDGSSTVFPISEAIAEEFAIENSKVNPTVGISGTGGGFKRFCIGETHISNASRPIKQSEIELCAANGVDFIEIPIAFDGITIAVNQENDWVDHLTIEELSIIFRPDSPALVWDDVRAEWPDVEIAVFSPGTDSGTFDYFTETVNGESGAQRTENSVFSEDDNILVIGVSGEEESIGYFGFSYYINNEDKLQAVPINGGSGPIFPTHETVNDGSYAPLSRPLFIYASICALEDLHIEAFLKFALTDGRVNATRLAGKRCGALFFAAGRTLSLSGSFPYSY